MSAVPASSSSSQPDPSPTPVLVSNLTETKQQVASANDDAACANKADDELDWYFAIGSMMNPTSMNLRNLFPKQSLPGILKGWKLVFRGGGGMGDIDEDAESSFHGVLHQVTCAEFKHLDSIEAIYRRTAVKVTLYNGEIINAFAYKMDRTKLDATIPDALPGERYLDIIIRGAIHYGVDKEYIENVLRKQAVIPRKKPSEYRLIPTPPNEIISKARLEAAVGGEGKEMMMSINGKVLLFKGDPNSNPSVKMQYEWTKNRFAGSDVTVTVAKTLYEPLYPIPTTYEAMLPEARLWSEELFYGFSRAAYPPEGYEFGNWRVVGWLEGMKPQ